MAFKIALNTDDPSHFEIEAELRQQLSALETVHFDVHSQPAPSGRSEYPGSNRLRHSSFSIRRKAFRWRLQLSICSTPPSLVFPAGMPEMIKIKKKQPPRAVIVIDKHQLSFPSSQNQQDKFLKAVEFDEAPDKAR